MILWVVELLEADESDDPAAAQIDDYVRGTLRYLVVDEYQDVNPIQEAIVWCLHELGAKVWILARTKREAVELGLKTLLQLNRQSELRRLRGKVKWEGDLDAMRRDK